MVEVLSYVALGASLLSLGSLIVLLRYVPVLRRASGAYVESSDVISDMMKELNERASVQDKRLVDAQVKLDTLEDRWLRTGWMASQVPVSMFSPSQAQTSVRHEYGATMIRRRQEPIQSPLKSEEGSRSGNHGDSGVPSKVEVTVLRSLVGRRMTAPEAKSVLGSSREHAARVMKSLADRGLVVRDTSKKPYSYTLSDIGRDMVTGNPLSDL